VSGSNRNDHRPIYRPTSGIATLVTAPADPLTDAGRTDHRIDTGADRSPWALLRNGDVPLVRVKSLDRLVDRHLYLARCGSWGTGRRVDGAVSDQEQRSAGCDARPERRTISTTDPATWT
jgi:hypothetical protein